MVTLTRMPVRSASTRMSNSCVHVGLRESAPLHSPSREKTLQVRLGIGLNDFSVRPPIEKLLLDPVVLGELDLVRPAGSTFSDREAIGRRVNICGWSLLRSSFCITDNQ